MRHYSTVVLFNFLFAEVKDLRPSHCVRQECHHYAREIADML